MAHAPARAAPTAASAAGAPAAAAATATASAPATAATAAATSLPQNLFTAAAQAAASARQGANPTGGAAAGGESLAFLRDQPQFQQIREMVHQNPDLLQPLLVQLGQSNPNMLQVRERSFFTANFSG